MNMEKSALLMIVPVFFAVFAGPSYAMSAKDMARILPDKVLDLTTTGEPPTIHDVQKGGGDYHRVQKLYNSKSGRMAVVAVIRGVSVTKDIAAQFAHGTSSLSIKGFKGVVNPASNPGAVSISVKLRDDQMITVVTLNTKTISFAKELLNALDLEGLAKLQ